MTPTQEAPVAQPEETLQPIAEGSSPEPIVEGQEPAAAAAPEVDPQVKKLRDRLAEQGRVNAENQRLALQQAQQIAALQGQLSQIGQYLTQQQQMAERARLQSMEPDQQIAYLSDKVLQLQANPPRVAPAPAPAQQEVAPVDPRVSAAVDEINAEFGLDDDPITAGEVGWHPTEEAWRKAATLIAKAKAKESQAPKPENKKPASEPSLKELVAQEVAKVTGVGRPNAATPTGAVKSGMTIEALNKMAADNSMSPRARAEAMRKLQG